MPQRPTSLGVLLASMPPLIATQRPSEILGDALFNRWLTWAKPLIDGVELGGTKIGRAYLQQRFLEALIEFQS
jgi:hypothetical protein